MPSKLIEKMIDDAVEKGVNIKNIVPAKPKSIPTKDAIVKICNSIHELDLTLLEMSLAVQEKGAGHERLEKYQNAVSDIQVMYRAMLGMVLEYEKLAIKERETFHLNQDLLRQIEILKKADAL